MPTILVWITFVFVVIVVAIQCRMNKLQSGINNIVQEQIKLLNRYQQLNNLKEPL